MTSIGAGTRIGPYEILRKLGAGGMGAVYEAVHEAIERRVAIKVLLPQSAENPEITTRFLNEARAVNRVGHPGMVQISDLGQLPDGTAYLVMELLVGETLGTRMRRLGGRLPLVQAFDLGSQIADALAAAHAKGIIHRDLKPENLMVVADPVAPRGERIKVLDFGIAKLTEVAGVTADTTRSNLLMGTPRYMSPEQCRGAGKIDAKADVYSLGVLLYQILAGRLPFVSTAPGELIVMHMTEAPPPLRSLAAEVPPPAAALVEQMLAKVATERPTMAEVAQHLQGLLRVQEGRLSGGLGDAAAPSGAVPVVPAQLQPVPAPPVLTPDPGPPSNITPISVTSVVAEASVAVNGPASQPTGVTTLGRSLGQSIGPTAQGSASRRRYLFAGPAVLLLCLGVLGVRQLKTPPAPIVRTVPAAPPAPAPKSTPPDPSQPESAAAPAPAPASPAPSAVSPATPRRAATKPSRGPAKPAGPVVSHPPTKKPERKSQGGKKFFDGID